MSTLLARALEALRPFSFLSTNEDDVQRAMAVVLRAVNIPFEREHALSPKDRLDFWFPDGGCIEVKTAGALAAVTRQLHRYATHEAITAIALATSVSRLRAMPDSLCGKPLHVFQLNWGAL